MLSQFVPLGLMLVDQNWYLHAEIVSGAPLMLLSSAQFMWGAVAISFCADLYAQFWAKLLRQLPLQLVGMSNSRLQRWWLMQSHWHPPCEDCVLAQTVLFQT